MTTLSNAEIFVSGLLVGAVVMAALITLAQSLADEMQRLQDRERERRTALPKVRW